LINDDSDNGRAKTVEKARGKDGTADSKGKK